MTATVIVVGMDAAWGGWGWCLADQDGPRQAGHVVMGPPSRKKRSTHRTARLAAYLAGPIAHALADGGLARASASPRLRVAIELPPSQYATGRQSAALGLGRLVGALELWATRPSLAYPWMLEPTEWRAWWDIAPTRRGRNGDDLKREAIFQVPARFGSQWVDPFPLGPKKKRKGAPARMPKTDTPGPRGDVAEAILIAVGAALYNDDAPAGPTSWPSAPAGRRVP